MLERPRHCRCFMSNLLLKLYYHHQAQVCFTDLKPDALPVTQPTLKETQSNDHKQGISPTTRPFFDPPLNSTRSQLSDASSVIKTLLDIITSYLRT